MPSSVRPATSTAWGRPCITLLTGQSALREQQRLRHPGRRLSRSVPATVRGGCDGAGASGSGLSEVPPEGAGPALPLSGSWPTTWAGSSGVSRCWHGRWGDWSVPGAGAAATRPRAGLLGAVAFFLVSGATVSTWFGFQARADADALAAEAVARANADKERQARQKEREANAVASRRLYGGQLSLTQSYWQEGKVAAARKTLNEAREHRDSWEYCYLHILVISALSGSSRDTPPPSRACASAPTANASPRRAGTSSSPAR